MKHTLFLPDGTPLRAEATVKPGLPANLSPSSLAAALRRSSANSHPGVVIVAMGDGSVRFNQSDLEFLQNRASRVPLSQGVSRGPGALFLDVSKTSASELQKFNQHLATIGTLPLKGLRLVEAADAAALTRMGSATLDSGQSRTAASTGAWNFQNAWPSKFTGPSPVGSSRNTAVVQWKLTNALPMKFTGPSLNAKGGTDVAMEEITLVYEHIELD